MGACAFENGPTPDRRSFIQASRCHHRDSMNLLSRGQIRLAIALSTAWLVTASASYAAVLNTYNEPFWLGTWWYVFPLASSAPPYTVSCATEYARTLQEIVSALCIYKFSAIGLSILLAYPIAIGCAVLVAFSCVRQGFRAPQ